MSEDYSIFSDFVEGFLVFNKERAETETKTEEEKKDVSELLLRKDGSWVNYGCKRKIL